MDTMDMMDIVPLYVNSGDNYYQDTVLHETLIFLRKAHTLMIVPTHQQTAPFS